jgi:hypothetical protein
VGDDPYLGPSVDVGGARGLSRIGRECSPRVDAGGYGFHRLVLP